MKRELTVQGMGWGHMPTYLVDEDLRDGRLLDISGKYLKGGQTEVVLRGGARAHGPVAGRLWRYIEEQAPAFVRHVTSSTSAGS